MSLAWGAVAFSVLLLPGFLFFVGLYFPEDFTRETAPRSALGHLAGVVSVSLFVHGLGLAILPLLPEQLPVLGEVPSLSVEHLLAVLQVQSSRPLTLAEIAAPLQHAAGWILTYVVLAGSVGCYLGYLVGHLIVRGPLRFLAAHDWVFDLYIEGRRERLLWPFQHMWRWFRTRKRVVRILGEVRFSWAAQVTMAYALSRIEGGDKRVLYRGYLSKFGLGVDGKPSYLLLSRPQRLYFQLKDQAPTVAPSDEWLPIGRASGRPGATGPSGTLFLYGTELVNVVFDQHDLTITARGIAEARRAVRGDEEVRDEERSPAQP